ncbi:MAG TPA: Holliday junction resolvase RuvX [Candidatus Saccharimonadales bacterium]|nr:Holliday junction resolvase RuvX [Candidatus Saccharimonadales bacterium]
MAVPDNNAQTLLALDIGEARVGLAVANTMARIAHPSGALLRTEHIFDDIAALCRRERVDTLVLGLPRGLQGQDTPQTAVARAFGETLAAHVSLPQVWQDEAVTSVRAEAELKQRRKPYTKGDIDALAATYILEDYLHAAV